MDISALVPLQDFGIGPPRSPPAAVRWASNRALPSASVARNTPVMRRRSPSHWKCGC